MCYGAILVFNTFNEQGDFIPRVIKWKLPALDKTHQEKGTIVT